MSTTLKQIFTGILLTLSLCVSADDYAYITAKTTSAEESFNLTEVKKITFTATSAILSTTTGDIVYPLTDFSRFYFSATPTDVRNMKAESSSLRYQGGVLEVKGTGLLRVYSDNGRLMSVAKVKGSASVSLESLPTGLFLISLNEETIKVVR